MENEKIRLCPYCKQEVKMNVGVHNWKNLFRKPTMEEWITLFIILCVISIYFVYQHDIKQYQDYISKNCNQRIGISKIPAVVNQSIIDVNITFNETNTNYSV